MLTPKDNFLETIHGGKPDRFVKQYEAFDLVRSDPVNNYAVGKKYPGMPPTIDAWGSRVIWPKGEPGAIPDQQYRILEDIEDWKDIIKLPDMIANCTDPALWDPYLEACAKVDRSEKLLLMTAPVGIFERMHYLMGFEDTLCNLMLEPELMEELSEAIGENRYQCFKLMIENAHPDAIIPHDDWGSKTNLFMRPEIWRELIKPYCKKGYDYIHEQGVLIIHHADSYCEPIVEDMVDMHIDVWQGVLPENDILKIQQQLGGRMALMGGISSTIVDRPDSTEEEIRTDVRRVCENYAKNGYFIPCITYGGPGCIHAGVDDIINDEIDRCSEEFFQKELV